MSRIAELQKEIEKEQTIQKERIKAILVQSGIVEKYLEMREVKINKEFLPGVLLKGICTYDSNYWDYSDISIDVDKKIKNKENKWFFDLLLVDISDWLSECVEDKILIPKENLSFFSTVEQIISKLAKENDIDEDDLHNVWAEMIQE